MNMQQGLETLRKTLIKKILQCLEGTAPKETFIELAAILNKTPEIHTDLSLFQSATLLDFLSTQLTNGNEDIVSPQIVRESCTYLLNKLTPGTPYIS
jgi:hypothetical protein